MTQSSPARLDKRLNKKKPAANKSFDQLVGDATLARLKPFIQQSVNQAAQQIVQSFYQISMNERTMMQTRQMAFERLLKENCPWFNEDVLALAVADVEDEASGMKVVDDAAQAGDKVRLEYEVKPKDQGEWTAPAKLAVHSLLTKGPGGNVQTNEGLEAGLVGLRVGESRELLLPEPTEEGQEPENTRVKVTVKRVSRVPEAPAAASAEAKANG
jgi:hypothetical protein